MRTDDYYGKIFGRLTVFEITHVNKHYQKKYRCVCECGTEKEVYRQHLNRDNGTLSCGCLHKEKAREVGKQSKKYDESHHFVVAYYNMIQRANDMEYSGYTENFNWAYEDFRDSMYEAYRKHVEEHGEKNTTLDRIDGTKGYYKENCRWLTRQLQNYNLKTTTFIEYNGEKKNFMEWANHFNSTLDMRLIKNRYRCLGWNIEKACTTPKRGGK